VHAHAPCTIIRRHSHTPYNTHTRYPYGDRQRETCTLGSRVRVRAVAATRKGGGAGVPHVSRTISHSVSHTLDPPTLDPRPSQASTRPSSWKKEERVGPPTTTRHIQTAQETTPRPTEPRPSTKAGPARPLSAASPTMGPQKHKHADRDPFNPPNHPPSDLVFTRHCFPARLLFTNQPSVHSARPTALPHPGAIPVHDYWAVYDSPSELSSCMLCTIQYW